MKSFLSWIGTRIFNAIITGVFFMMVVLWIAYAAISWPSTTPSGEITGGKFSKLFQTCPPTKILQGFDINTGIICADISSTGNGGFFDNWYVQSQLYMQYNSAVSITNCIPSGGIACHVTNKITGGCGCKSGTTAYEISRSTVPEQCPLAGFNEIIAYACK